MTSRGRAYGQPGGHACGHRHQRRLHDGYPAVAFEHGLPLRQIYRGHARPRRRAELQVVSGERQGAPDTGGVRSSCEQSINRLGRPGDSSVLRCAPRPATVPARAGASGSPPGSRPVHVVVAVARRPPASAVPAPNHPRRGAR